MKTPLGVLALLLLSGAALAQEQPATPKDVLELFPRGQDACYAARLEEGRGPKAKLAEFYLYRLFDPDPRKEDIDLTREEAVAMDLRASEPHGTDVLARFSDSPHVFTQSVSCMSDPGDVPPISCAVDCDGGSFLLSRKGKDAGVTFDAEGGLSMNLGCGEEEEGQPGRLLTLDDAGGPFTAFKAEPAKCLAASRLAVPRYAKDPVPLRQRIEEGGWRCLSRRYSKEHLAKHPKQNVTAIALKIKDKPRVSREDGYPVTSLKAALSFRLRSGATASRDVECYAAGFEFACESFRLRRNDERSAMLAAGSYTDPQQPIAMLDTELGADDALFRLDASQDESCGVE